MFKELHMCKEVTVRPTFKTRKRRDKQWFNDKCKKSKREYMTYKKNVKYNKQNEVRETLRIMAKKHKQVLRTAKRSYDKEFQNKLKSVKPHNPQEYWNLLNKLLIYLGYH